MKPHRRGLLAAAVAAAAAATATLLAAGCERSAGPGGAPAFKAIDITGADYAGRLALPDADGRVRTLDEFRGRVVAVFFGYTQCPDVCPTTMAEIVQAKALLGNAGRDVTAIFVSVDPERDTPAVLKPYVASFGPDVVGLVGTPEQTAATAKSFKVFYAKAPGKTTSTYTIDHTAGIYVFDRRGRVRLFTRHGSGAQALADDLRILLAEPG